MPEDVTQLLIAWNEGDQAALDRLIPIVYQELRRIAVRHMRRERSGHTLQTTALVNEAYLRLINARDVRWQNRAHFFAISAQLMRRILVDFARRRNQQKRGGAITKVTLDEGLAVSQQESPDIAALDEALGRLAALDQRQAKIVELRYFGGLTEEETAEVLKVSVRTVRRDWTLARAWLYRELSSEGHDDA
jgi:RNA polymerase sigma factor (TIGR02999 family)